MRLMWSLISTGWPGRARRAQAAAAVGQHDDLGARGDRGPHAVHDGRDAAALVEVGAAEEDQRPLVADADRADACRRGPRRRRREAGQLGDRELGVGLAEHLGGRHPAGAHHQGDVVVLDAGQSASRLAASSARAYGSAVASLTARR